jgi:hypothetical protein
VKYTRADGCWIWTAAINSHGYGQFQFSRRYIAASRIAFVLHNGEVRADVLVRHKCDNRRCVNPAHLEEGTHADNSRDTVERGRTHKVHSDDSVREIRDSRARGETYRSIAARLSIPETTVFYIAAGKFRTMAGVSA